MTWLNKSVRSQDARLAALETSVIEIQNQTATLVEQGLETSKAGIAAIDGKLAALGNDGQDTWVPGQDTGTANAVLDPWGSVQAPWSIKDVYPATTTKQDAEAQIEAAGMDNGRFLVRRHRTKAGSYVLAVVYKGKPTHHLIATNAAGKMEINKKNFGNATRLEDLIKFLERKQPGWPVALDKPVTFDAGGIVSLETPPPFSAVNFGHTLETNQSVIPTLSSELDSASEDEEQAPSYATTWASIISTVVAESNSEV